MAYSPTTQGAIPGANIAGSNLSMAGTGLTGGTGGFGGLTNPMLPAFPSGSTVGSSPVLGSTTMGTLASNLGTVPSSQPAAGGSSAFTAYSSPYGSSQVGGLLGQLGNIPGSQTTFFEGLKSAGYPKQIASALSNFLQTGAGFNSQVAQSLLAALQPAFAKGEANIMEQFGASGLGQSSAAAIGLGDYQAQEYLAQGQLLSQMYEQSVQNYMDILTGSKKQSGTGILSSLSSMLGGGLSTASGGMSGTLGEILGGLGGFFGA